MTGTATPRPVTLITGASAGIGAALAREFAARGHEVALVARRQAQLDEVAHAIVTAGGRPAHAIAIDLAEPDAGDAVARALAARDLEPDIVVNNAGFGLLGNARRLDRDEQLRMIDLNNRALTDLSLRFIASLERHRGGILNVSSIAAFVPAPGMAVYHATKAYVLSLSEALHVELAPKGIRVTALCAGPVHTEFNARGGIPDSYFPPILHCAAEDVARAGYEGLRRGRRVVVPGVANKIATALPRLVPRAWTAWFMDWRGSAR